MPILDSNSSPEELARMGFEMATPKEVIELRGEVLELREENENLRNEVVRLRLRGESAEKRLDQATSDLRAVLLPTDLFTGLNQVSLGKLADGFSELVPRSPEPRSILYTPTEHPVADSPARGDMPELGVERKD